jgi:hypothetical protein
VRPSTLRHFFGPPDEDGGDDDGLVVVGCGAGDVLVTGLLVVGAGPGCDVLALGLGCGDGWGDVPGVETVTTRWVEPGGWPDAPGAVRPGCDPLARCGPGGADCEYAGGGGPPIAPGCWCTAGVEVTSTAAAMAPAAAVAAPVIVAITLCARTAADTCPAAVCATSPAATGSGR